jgi:NNP family nitrate/nitrite transporter-like MFS transporter
MSESTKSKTAGGPEVGNSPRRWAVVLAIMLVGACGIYNQIAVGALGPKVMEQLDISQTQLANMMTAPLLCSVLFGLVLGSLGDRFGPTRVVGLALAAAVLGTVVRIFADSFTLGFLSMLLLGMKAALTANLPKLLSAWFRPTQMGFAVGIYMTGMAGGTGLAQATAARLGEPRQAFTVCAVMMAAVVVLFFAVVRDRPKGQAAPVAQKKKSSGALVGEILRNKHVWMLAGAMLFFNGWQMVFANFLPTMLNKGHNMELATAGTFGSAFAWGGLAGCFIMPAIAARTGRMKPVIMGGALLAGAAVYLAWVTAPSPITMLFLALAGCGGAAISCLVTTAPALLDSIGPAKAGTAGGVIATIAPLGGYVIPSFVVSPIAGTNYTLMTIMGAITVALAFFAMIGVPEYGPRRVSRDAAAKKGLAA